MKKRRSIASRQKPKEQKQKQKRRQTGDAWKNEVDLFMHSRCCKAGWALVVKEKEYHLVCEKCGKPSGVTIVEKPPEKCECEECGRGGTVH